VYRLIDFDALMSVLYSLCKWGYPGNSIPRPGVEGYNDANHDFFRVRLVCTIIDSCGYLIIHSRAKADKFERFIFLFQVCRGIC
jgi:regulator of nonsense transcripts 2